MGIFSNNKIKTPELKILKKVGKAGRIKSGIIFSLKYGYGRLYEKKAEIVGDYVYNSQLMLGDIPLVQHVDPMCPTCEMLISAGYGIENTGCAELREICDRINGDFVDIETSFEDLRPLLGILKDGYYMLADTECYPTDGGNINMDGKFFWDIDPKPKKYEASCDHIYVGEEDGCRLFTAASITPSFLYPTQSAAKYDPERAEYYRQRIQGENAPRAIAYNDLCGMSALLDGHHKAAAAALNGQSVKTLVIIPVQYRETVKGDKGRIVFSEGCTLSKEELGDKGWEDYLAFEEYKRRERNMQKEFDLNEPRSAVREWEKIFAENSTLYPTARMMVLENEFGIDSGYDEMAEYFGSEARSGRDFLSLAAEDKFGFGRNAAKTSAVMVGMKLVLIRAICMRDMTLKEFALSMAGQTHDFPIKSTALRYLVMFRGDRDIEPLMVDIISDPDKYRIYGDIAIDFWEDERADS